MAGVTRAGEFELIHRYFAPLARGAAGAFGLTDDAAILDVPAGRRLVVTADALVSGVHFLVSDPPGDVAAKVLGVNLSDLAAMGAEPLAYVLTVALPESLEESWIAAFAEGLGEGQRTHGISLVGGDTVATPGPLTLTLCALGKVAADGGLRRAGARPGDMVFVSGTLGDAALGLGVLQGTIVGLAANHRDHLVDRYRRPRPRTTLGPALDGLAHAAIDVSDGLVADLGHICETSGIAAVIETARLPLSDAAGAVVAKNPEVLDRVLGGGDDYELLFAAPPTASEALNVLSRELDVPITAIGRFETMSGESGEWVRVIDAEGRERMLSGRGYRHF